MNTSVRSSGKQPSPGELIAERIVHLRDASNGDRQSLIDASEVSINPGSRRSEFEARE